jgi:hypothetical protein
MFAKEISAFLRAESGDDATDPTQELQNLGLNSVRAIRSTNESHRVLSL